MLHAQRPSTITTLHTPIETEARLGNIRRELEEKVAGLCVAQRRPAYGSYNSIVAEPAPPSRRLLPLPSQMICKPRSTCPSPQAPPSRRQNSDRKLKLKISDTEKKLTL